MKENDVKRKIMSRFELNEAQKTMVCDYYACSDRDDYQYPDCELRKSRYLKCPLNRMEGLFVELESKDAVK